MALDHATAGERVVLGLVGDLEQRGELRGRGRRVELELGGADRVRNLVDANLTTTRGFNRYMKRA